MEKRCSKCGMSQPLTEFGPDKRASDGLSSSCRRCARVAWIGRKDRQNELKRIRNQENPERARTYRQKHRARRTAYNVAWYKQLKQTNPEAYRILMARRKLYQHSGNAWKQSHKDAVREYLRGWKQANKDKVRQHRRTLYRKNPMSFLIREHRRRARMLSNGGSYTQKQWAALCDWFGNACLRCGVTGRLTVDHVIPIARGGTNDIANLQPLCGSCNSGKKDRYADYRDPDRLAAFLLTLSEE